MKSIQISTNEVARVAAKNIIINGSDTITAVAKSAELQALKSRLMRGEICKWVYRKVSGEIRVCTGTLFNDIVKSMVVGGNTPKKYFGQFAYIEIFTDEKGAVSLEWRSFREENFIGTIEN